MELVAEKYKKTELGTIPEDWNIKEFQEVMEGFSSGQTPYRGNPEYYKGNIPWITSGELNYNVITDTKEKITPEGARSANLKFIPKGTFLFAITGLEAAGTRGSCAITGIEATTNQSCMALYPKAGLLTTTYLYHFYVRYGNELAFKYCQGTKQQSYTGGIAKKLPIIVPPTIEEQTAIATALSDIDALISSLEDLIEKKRMIKQGAMQELLKPKEGWVVKRIGDISKVGRGRVISHREIDLAVDKKYPVYSSQTTNNGIMGYLDNYDFDGEYITWTTDGEKAGTVFYRNGKFNCTNVCGTIKLTEGNPIFVALLLSTVTSKHVSKNLANPKLMNDPMKQIEVALPNIVEQNAIATTITGLGEEIYALDEKLTKIRQIKQGMMQNLLTGKIRLI